MVAYFTSELALPDGVSVGMVRGGVRLEDYEIWDGEESLHPHKSVVVITAEDTFVYFLDNLSTHNRKVCLLDRAKFTVTADNLVFAEKPGFVYLVHAIGSVRYKIGYSKDPIRRFKELQGEQPGQAPYDLDLIAASPMVPNMDLLEADWHQTLREFRAKGEWFELPEDLAKNTAIRIREGLKPSLFKSSSFDAWDWTELRDGSNHMLYMERQSRGIVSQMLSQCPSLRKPKPQKVLSALVSAEDKPWGF